ncbi:MAG: glycosyltransferase family 39 protein, partial [Planctomycetaceae bacterium]|nr:glycosyltransferase family 39 protein [Planctomycetaceae bacterium]
LGLGLLCRYDTFLLVAALFAFTLWSDRARRCWDTSRPFLAAGVIALVFLPHGWWLASHVRTIGSSTLDYLVATEQVRETTNHWALQLAALLPVLIVLAPLVNWFNPPEEESDPDLEFTKQYLVWVSCLPPAIMVVLSIMNGFPIDAMWASPLWIFGGVLFLMWSRLDETRFSWRQALTWTGTATGMIAAALFAVYVLFPPSVDQGYEVHFPGRSLSQLVMKSWKEKYPDRKLPAIGGPWWLAENAAWYSTDRPRVFGDLDIRENSVRDKVRLEESGGVIILDKSARLSQAEEQYLTQLNEVTQLQISLPIELPWQHTTSAKTGPVTVQVAVIPPRDMRAAMSGQVPAPASATPILDGGSLLNNPIPGGTPDLSAPATPSPAANPTSPSADPQFRSTIPAGARVPQPTTSVPVNAAPSATSPTNFSAPAQRIESTIPNRSTSSNPPNGGLFVQPVSGVEPTTATATPATFRAPVPASSANDAYAPAQLNSGVSSIPSASSSLPYNDPFAAPSTAPVVSPAASNLPSNTAAPTSLPAWATDPAPSSSIPSGAQPSLTSPYPFAR